MNVEAGSGVFPGGRRMRVGNQSGLKATGDGHSISREACDADSLPVEARSW